MERQALIKRLSEEKMMQYLGIKQKFILIPKTKSISSQPEAHNSHEVEL